MSTGSTDGGGTADLRALGRTFEARRLELGMKPDELAIAAGLAGAESPSVSIEAGRIRALERCGWGGPLSDFRPGNDACLETIERLAGALGIDDATVLACGGVDLARWRWKRKVASPEYQRRLDEFMRNEFEKDGRPPPNVMVGPYGWYARKRAHFEAMHAAGLGGQDHAPDHSARRPAGEFHDPSPAERQSMNEGGRT